MLARPSHRDRKTGENPNCAWIHILYHKPSFSLSVKPRRCAARFGVGDTRLSTKMLPSPFATSSTSTSTICVYLALLMILSLLLPLVSPLHLSIYPVQSYHHTPVTPLSHCVALFHPPALTRFALATGVTPLHISQGVSYLSDRLSRPIHPFVPNTPCYSYTDTVVALVNALQMVDNNRDTETTTDNTKQDKTLTLQLFDTPCDLDSYGCDTKDLDEVAIGG